MLDVQKIRESFPIYQKHPKLVYLDTSATSLTPEPVLEKMNEYYREYGVNIHRGVYQLSYLATEEYEKAREVIASFMNAKAEETVFFKNVSSALNFLALTLGERTLKPGDEVITCELEHHSSFLPWQQVCIKTGATLRFVPLNQEGRLTTEAFKDVLNAKTKVVALTYLSNVMGYITPIEEIIRLAHEVGAVVIVDAAQAVPHMQMDVQKLDCDYLAFSGHKMFGPTGIGVLYGKAKLLRNIQPLEYGGDMNEDVYKEGLTIKDIPHRFETGTPPIAEVVGLRRAIEYLWSIGYKEIEEHISFLHQYALSKLENIEGLTLYNKGADIGIMTFNIDGVHPHDAATPFDENNIAIRAGHHCAQLVSRFLNCTGTLRASLYVYNDVQDVDRFVQAVIDTIAYFKQFEGGTL
jgi:cysteine desulfurase / selenocysteine lyase